MKKLLIVCIVSFLFFFLCKSLIADDSVHYSNIPPTPSELISAEFKDAPIMLKIAQAESRICTDNKNPKSSAKGCFQILDSTWKSAKCSGDVLDVSDNIACARKLYNESKTKSWNASKEIWSVLK